MQEALTFPPFQVCRRESFYREVPVTALERLYLAEFGWAEGENVLSCGSAVYGISSNEEINRLRRFSDVDYIVISKADDKKPHYRIRKKPRWDIDVLRLGYDSCIRGVRDGALLVLLTLARFAVPLFGSEDSYLELTSRAMSRILEMSLSHEELLITPSYAMMKINDTRMRYKPHRWWSVYGEFALSPNANRNIQVYYDRVAAAMERLLEQGLLARVNADCPEPVFDTSGLARHGRQAPWVWDVTTLHCEQIMAFLLRGRVNVPSLKKLVHVTYDGFNVASGVLKRTNNCVALFDARPQKVTVSIA